MTHGTLRLTVPRGQPEDDPLHALRKYFETEAEAKRFARLKLAEGRTVNAGTINPHVPRQWISAADIHRWLKWMTLTRWPNKNGRGEATEAVS